MVGLTELIAKSLSLIRRLLRQAATPTSIRAAAFKGYRALFDKLDATDLQIGEIEAQLAACATDLGDQSHQPEVIRQAAADALAALSKLVAPSDQAEKSGSQAELCVGLAFVIDAARAAEKAPTVQRTLRDAHDRLQTLQKRKNAAQ